MGSKEKIPTQIDKIQQYVDEDVVKHEGDLNPSKFRHFYSKDNQSKGRIELLIPEARKVFDTVMSGDSKTLESQVQAFREALDKLDKIKDKDVVEINDAFVKLIDNMKNPEVDETKDFNLTDNVG